jgi:aminopeptidase YwaD
MIRTLSRAAVAALLLPALLAAQAQPQSSTYDAIRAELAAARKLPRALNTALTPVIDRVWDEFNRETAIDQVRFMDQYWRNPGNEGFDKSIDRVRDRLVASGFKDIGTRPAGPITAPSVWIEPAATTSRGWDQSVATLAIVRDGQPEQVVLSKAKERLALCINSFSTAPGGVTAPLIDVGNGGTAGDYTGKDVKGAVVIGDAGIGQLFTQAVVNRGALGVVTRQKPAAYIDKNPDILQWGSIAYDEARKSFGFKSTARASEALTAAAKTANARVRVEIVASFANKPERTLVAEIPGASVPNERVIVAAHVQEPGANDNASGVATNMELSRALAVGIAAGRIPKPARTLTFLWVNEIAGSRRWLTEHADQKDGVRYMFSMDMTGEDITKTGGHFLVERWPDPGAVWARPWDPHSEWGAGNVRADSLKGDLINDLHLAICERVAEKSLASAKRAWDVRSNPYEGGSDHTQFGTAGIPSVLDWHFTDRFYHTNQDTAEKTSPDEMRNVGTAVATSVWLMASANAAQGASVRELITRVGDARVKIEAREGAVAGLAVTPADNATIVAAWRKWYDEAIKSVDRLIVTAAPRAPLPAQRFRVTPASFSQQAVLQNPDVTELNPRGTHFACQPQFQVIEPTVVNVLWAIDDRLWCFCSQHVGHKEGFETRVIAEAARSTSSILRRVATLAVGRLDSPDGILANPPLIPTLLNDVNAVVRAEAANALAQSVSGVQPDLRRGRQTTTIDVANAASLLRAALTTASTLSAPASRGSRSGGVPAGGLAPMPTGGVGEMNDEAAGAMLAALGRLSYSEEDAASTVNLLSSHIDITRPVDRILGALKGLETLTRKNRRIRLDEDTRKRVRSSSKMGRGELTRAPSAFQNARPENDLFEKYARIRRLSMQVLQAASDGDKETILAAARDGDWQVRRFGTMMLGGADPAAANYDASLGRELDERLKDQAFQVRFEAVKIAARIARRQGECDVLAGFIDDKAPIVSMQAIDELATIACKPLEPIVEKLSSMAAVVEQKTETATWQQSMRALTTLSRIAPPAAEKFVGLSAFSEHAAWQMRAAVVSAQAQLKNEKAVLSFLADPHANVREAALDGLRTLGSAELHPAALDALEHADYQLVMNAANHLKGVADKEGAAQKLFAALKRITQEGKDTSRDPRMAIIERLGEVANPELLPWAQDYLEDFDPKIAEAAMALCYKLIPAPGVTFKTNPKYRLPEQPTLEEVQQLPRKATLQMSDGGKIELELLVDEAPITVFRFAKLARSGYYNNLTFHRVVPNFVVQGLSPGANEYVGDARYMRDEVGRVSHLRGAVGISTRGRDTGDGQIFIDLVDVPRLDHDYTVFAKVTAGMDVVDRILEGAVVLKVIVQ